MLLGGIKWGNSQTIMIFTARFNPNTIQRYWFHEKEFYVLSRKVGRSI